MNEIKILGVVCFVVFVCWLFIEKFTNRSNRGLQQKHGDIDVSSPLRAETVKTCEPGNNLKHTTSEESDAPPASDDPNSPYYITKQQHRLNIMRAESILEKEIQRRISEQKKAGTYVKAKTKKELQDEENLKEFREYFENKHREKRSSFLIGIPLYLLILAVGSWVIYAAERDFGGFGVIAAVAILFAIWELLLKNAKQRK